MNEATENGGKKTLKHLLRNVHAFLLKSYKQFKHAATGVKVMRALITVLCYLLCVLMLLFELRPKQYALEVGSIPDEPIAAPSSITDELSTEAAREKAAAAVSPIYTTDNSVTEDVLTTLDIMRENVQSVQALYQKEIDSYYANLVVTYKLDEDGNQLLDENGDPIPEPTESFNTEKHLDHAFYAECERILGVELSEDSLYLALAQADSSEIDILFENMSMLIEDEMLAGLKEEDVIYAANRIRESIYSSSYSESLKFAAGQMAVSLLTANRFYDVSATEAARQEARDAVIPVVYQKGQYIVEAGQPVTESQYALLMELGLLSDAGLQPRYIVGVFLYCMAVFVVTLLGVHSHINKKEVTLRSYTLFMTLLAVGMALCILCEQLNTGFMPVVAVAMLARVLLNRRCGYAVGIGVSLLMALVGENAAIETFMYGATMTCAAVGTAVNISKRGKTVWPSVFSGFVGAVVIACFRLLNNLGLRSAVEEYMWAISTGVVSTILTIGTLSIWENLFGIVTIMKLMELSNLNTPLLNRMVREAPGTYYHSSMVGNLAEAAAYAIGANGLLAKVGSYYHDVGKLKNPLLFKENQLNSENPHNDMKPLESARIILNHTDYGYELAKKNRLPKQICDFTKQHHGTQLVSYFYAMAQKEDPDTNPNLFRYSGPVPSSKEIAIVMMADTIEAVMRTMADKSSEEVNRKIRSLIMDKANDGQFDGSDITLSELETIITSFEETCERLYHKRIAYPELDRNKLRHAEELVNRGGSDVKM